MILLYILILIIGFIALIKGADTFVGGSSALAKNFKVPSLIIGLTIVALGTSAPELAVSVSAAIQGSNEIALSNVIGSNIFNLLAVLGICAIIFPLPVEKVVLKRDFPFSIITTILLLFLICGSSLFSSALLATPINENIGTISRLSALILIILFIGYIVYLIYDTKKHPTIEEEEEKTPISKCFILIIAGLILIVAGGQATVYAAKEIARAAGMSETLIGLTIVAIGTSLPELVTSIVAARKNETDLAIGNALGSNIFNLLFILGTSAIIHPIAVNMASIYDMLILIFVTILTYIFALSKDKITHVEGITMVIIYILDVLYAVIR